ITHAYAECKRKTPEISKVLSFWRFASYALDFFQQLISLSGWALNYNGYLREFSLHEDLQI
ncbi:MAG: hypothetical protein IJP92_09660, partial [Lachnospiraceae bacterium]|nr:hypothetical protein [Lachnospiraceae bacterium]